MGVELGGLTSLADAPAASESVSDQPTRSPESGHDRGRTVLLVTGLVAVAAGIPLAVALGVLRQPHWYPTLDMAQTELRVRDVGGGHPPLVGAIGRFASSGQRGSHPGPLSFWALWPFYKVLGGSAWALQVATAVLNLLAMGLAVWIAHRRGGARLALAAGVGLAVLSQAYTAERLTTPWNPYLTLLWWMVFLLAVWAVLCDDLPMLPVAVLSGSFCAQTHISYLGLVGGVGLVLVLALAWWFARSPGRRRALAAWAGRSLGLLAILWLPPLIELLPNDLGNVTLVRESFANPDGEPTGFGDALRTWLAHLDLTGLVHIDGALDISLAPRGSPVPGVMLLVAWGLAAAVSWRRQRHDRLGLWRLHLLVALAAALGLVMVSRVVGYLWDYLVLWAWGTTVLMLLAILLTVLSLLPPTTVRQQGATLAAALVVVGIIFTWGAAHSQPHGFRESRSMAQLQPGVEAALRDGQLADGTRVPGGGADGRYLVQWFENELAIPGIGFGLLLELERQGFDVGGPKAEGTAIVPHRVRQLDDATATINYVVGAGNIVRWWFEPGAVKVAYVDPRTPAERRRYGRLRDEVAAELRDTGHDDLAEGLYVNVLATLFDEEMPQRIEDKASELLDLGAPMAVFVAPPAAS